MNSVIQKLKYWFSYIHEFPVELVKSPVSGSLSISYYKGRYLLSSLNSIYSYEDRYTSFRTVFERLKPEGRLIKKTLILGYGLGSIPLILSKRHGVHCSYTGVDSDPVVLALAKKYNPFTSPALNLICADAYDYVMNCKEQFELINVDIFVDDVTPPQFEKEEFLVNLKKLLSKNGLLIFSRYYYKNEHKKLTDRFKSIFEQTFPGSEYIKTDGNLMFVFDGSVSSPLVKS